ncbi:unnamed protein product [Calypogeia fissa]
MVNFLPLRPLLRHRQQQLSQCSTSIPLCSNGIFGSVQSPQNWLHSCSVHQNSAEEVRWCSPSRWCSKRRNLLLHCSVSAAYGGGVSSVDSKGLRKISSLVQKGGDGHISAGYSWRGRRIGCGGAKGSNKRLQLQLVGGYGYEGKSFHDDSDDVSLGRAAAARGASRSEGVECVEEDVAEKKNHEVVIAFDDVRILANYMTRHNYVRVLEVSRTADSVLAGARVLLLDKPGNVHSIYQRYKVLTDSYYDIMAALPAIIPEGPIGILGLGAGTAARLIHHFWAEIDMHGWELDPGVIQAARKFFDLEELEWKESNDIFTEKNAEKNGEKNSFDLNVLQWKESKDISEKNAETNVQTLNPKPHRRRNSSGTYNLWADESDEVKLSLFQGFDQRPGNRHNNGLLRVHIGDALDDQNVAIEGGFSGLIVDLFAEGAVIPELQQIDIWRKLRAKLRPNGRIIVNCGGSCVEAVEKNGVRKDGEITARETLAAIADVFKGELSVTYLRDRGDNSIALTGPPPDLEVWRDTLPECLRLGIEGFTPY